MTEKAVKEALDILKYDEQKSFKLSFELSTTFAKDGDFAEEFIERDGLSVLISLLKSTKGAFQGYVLAALRSLLLYVNAIDEVAQNPDLVDRLYVLLGTQPESGQKANLNVQKQTLEIFIVIIGMLDDGHKLVNHAAKLRRADTQPYGFIAALLLSPDLLVVRNSLTFLNMLLTKRKACSDKKLKKLIFRLDQGGVMHNVRQLVTVEDDIVKKQLTVFQKLTNVSIPQSFYEAEQWKTKYDSMKKEFDSINETLFVLRQQQPKYLLLKRELARAHETIDALSLMYNTSPNYHPTGRADGKDAYQGIKTVDISQIMENAKVSELRSHIFNRFIEAPEFKEKITKIAVAMGGRRGGGGGGGGPVFRDPFDGLDDIEFEEDRPRRGRGGRGAKGRLPVDSDSDVPPPDSDDDLPPPDSDDDLPPPDSDDDLPPPDSDDDAPPGGAKPRRVGGQKGGKARKGVAGGADGGDDVDVGAPGAGGVKDTGGPTAAGSDGAGTGVAGGVATGEPQQEGGGVAQGTVPSAAGAGAVTNTAADAPPSDDAATAAVGSVDATAQEAAPYYADPAAAAQAYDYSQPQAAYDPNQAAPTYDYSQYQQPAQYSYPTAAAGYGGGYAAAAPATPEIQYWKGPAPTKKMRVFHWDKFKVENDFAFWNKIHNGDIDCSYNYDEFESMFSQKETTAKEKKPVVVKVQLIEAKKFQNISIMLHKLPKIPQIQRGVLDLDDDMIPKESLEAMIAQSPQPEDVKDFTSKQDKKPVEEYEPPEQFFAMVMSTTEFEKRCRAWLFTRDWEENIVSAMKPITRVATAIHDVRQCKSLPYILGLILGFGNMMNCGNKAKGNAPGFHYNTLSKLDTLKDKSGKVSLFSYLVTTVQMQNPSAMEFPEEVKTCLNNVVSVKSDDIEKSVKEASEMLTRFRMQVKTVKDKLLQEGAGEDDVFIVRMTAFYKKAEAELAELQDVVNKLKADFKDVLEWWSCPSRMLSDPKPEEFFSEFVPFVQKFKALAADYVKEKKKQAKKGQKLGADKAAGDGDVMGAIVTQLQEKLVTG
eukprot:PhM_4_TR728/c1_g1_i1/m.47932